MGFKDGRINNNDRYGRGGSVDPGYRFRTGDKLYSADGSYYLSFQDDGNLVLSTETVMLSGEQEP
jgi:hypothetical protein